MASSSGKATQPTGACNGTAADFPNIEQELYDYQMHTKMCKKIAQLTKVIYSLNTKNEEQEAALQSLQEAHQEELHRITKDAKRRSRTESREEAEGGLEEIDNEEGGEAELRRRVQALEGSLEEQLRLNVEAQADFEAYRRQAEEQAEAASEEAQGARRDAEARLDQLGRAAERLEREKEEAQEEARRLREEREELSRSSEDERGRLEEACQDRTLALREELEALREANRRLEEACQQTVGELKEAHREEQEAMRRGLADALAQWKQREQEQEQSQRASLQDRLARLEDELQTATHRLSESKRHCLKAQERTQDLEGQLEEARRRVAGAELVAKKAEEELAVAKERLLLQENELLNKSEELLSQCSSQSKASLEVDQLRAQVCHLQKQVRELEQQTSGKTIDHAQQVKQQVEALSTQRQELLRAHAEELRRVRRQTEEERGRLKEQLRKRLEEMMKKHAGELRSARAATETERKKAQRDLQTQADELKQRIEEERMELEREKEELQRRLQESVCQGQEASGTLQPCSSQCDRLRVELEQAICSVTQTEEDLEQLKEKHQVEISALKKEKQILEDRIVEQAQKYHEEKKRSESESEFRRHELAEQHLSALARLRRDKDSEIKEIKDSFQRKKKLEGRRIDPGTDMRSTGEPLSDSDSECLEREMENTVRLNHSLRAQLLSPSQGTEQLIHRQDIKDAEDCLWLQHEEVLRAEWQSHQQALRALEERAQEELQAERHRQQAQQKLLLDRQKAELSQQHAEWCRQITQRHMQQIEDLQAELRTHTELVALQQDFKQQNQAQAFERQLEESRAEVAGLRRENGQLKEQLASLHSQVDSKTQEPYRLQDPEQHPRCWDEGAKNRQHLEVENLKREHRKEIQTIVSDFSSAQTRLQARIVSLETELREKEEKCKRRESRIEDLQVIGMLQDKLSERDQVIKRLVEERHHLHQHPLVASDSSTLKTYENRPQPGSLTPTLRKKKMEDTPPRVISVPNLSSYERSFLGPESAAAGARSPQAVKSPSFEHGPGRTTPRTATPTTPVPPPIMESPRQGVRYSRGSPSDDYHQGVTSYGQPPRTPSEQRPLEPGSEGQDPQRQEWFTKYFSF